jgi:very-short-patch-repair endonuclease
MGSVRALGGIDDEGLRVILDEIEPARCKRRALFVRITPAATAEAVVEEVIDSLAETSRSLWPVWFTDVSFGKCRNDILGHLTLGAIARNAAEEIIGLSFAWAEPAARLALDGRTPRVKDTLPATELAQLALTISRTGLVIVADLGVAARNTSNPAALLHALEWIAWHAPSAVVALFSELPPNEPPFDRILYGAAQITEQVVATPEATEPVIHESWIAPWRGLPHPFSEPEQLLAKALSADAELASLFGYNQVVRTVRGSRPKVDLVWIEGRLVVEVDGYGSHGSRTAFMHDRHRDYELTLSGYTVLRLANDEVAQDVDKAVEKIRDVVKLCRTRTKAEGLGGKNQQINS